jgi:hypothetical protein
MSYQQQHIQYFVSLLEGEGEISCHDTLQSSYEDHQIVRNNFDFNKYVNQNQLLYLTFI